MKQITLPRELLNLPCPWRMTHWQQRHQQIKTLSSGPKEVKRALNVLERCLCAYWQLFHPSPDSIPESLYEYWGFSADWLADKMPTFNEFDLLQVEEFLIEEGIDSPSATLIFDVGSYWLWWVTRSITRAVLDFLTTALKEAQESPQALYFLRIVDRYYWRVDESMKGSLLLASASIGSDSALPLLKCVEQNKSSSPDLRQSAQDYQQWILGSNGVVANERKQKTKHFAQRTPQLAGQYWV